MSTLTSNSFSDVELIEQIRGGNSDAFETLVNRYRHACMRVACAILRNGDDAEEEVQNAFVSAYQHLGSFEQRAQFSTWMTRIVANQCLMRLRRDRRMRTTDLDQLGNSSHHHRASSDSPERSLGSQQVQDLLMVEVRRLPVLFRDVMVLRDVHGQSLEETAESLGVTVQTVKSRLFRARQEMRRRLARHCGRRGVGTLTV